MKQDRPVDHQLLKPCNTVGMYVSMRTCFLRGGTRHAGRSVCLPADIVGGFSGMPANTDEAFPTAMLLARGRCRIHQAPRPAAQVLRVLQPQAAPGGTRQPHKPAAGGDIQLTSDSATSGGVHVQRKSVQDMQAAVSTKTFKCTQCGKCCSFLDDAEVWVSPEEVSRMAGHLGVSDDAFMASFTQFTDLSGWRMLEAKQAGPGSALTGDVCVFLDPLSLQCTIHTVRPLQCSTFPWWPELMHPRVWQDVKDNLCEGLDHAEAGPLDVADAAQQLQAATEHVLQLDAVMPGGWADSHYEEQTDSSPHAQDQQGQPY